MGDQPPMTQEELAEQWLRQDEPDDGWRPDPPSYDDRRLDLAVAPEDLRHFGDMLAADATTFLDSQRAALTGLAGRFPNFVGFAADSASDLAGEAPAGAMAEGSDFQQTYLTSWTMLQTLLIEAWAGLGLLGIGAKRVDAQYEMADVLGNTPGRNGFATENGYHLNAVSNIFNEDDDRTGPRGDDPLREEAEERWQVHFDRAEESGDYQPGEPILVGDTDIRAEETVNQGQPGEYTRGSDGEHVFIADGADRSAAQSRSHDDPREGDLGDVFIGRDPDPQPQPREVELD